MPRPARRNERDEDFFLSGATRLPTDVLDGSAKPQSSRAIASPRLPSEGGLCVNQGYGKPSAVAFHHADVRLPCQLSEARLPAQHPGDAVHCFLWLRYGEFARPPGFLCPTTLGKRGGRDHRPLTDRALLHDRGRF